MNAETDQINRSYDKITIFSKIYRNEKQFEALFVYSKVRKLAFDK